MLKQWRETRSNDDNAPNTLCTYRKHHTFWLAIKTKYFGFSVRNNKKKNEDYANILMEKLQTSCALFLDSLHRNHFERGKKMWQKSILSKVNMEKRQVKLTHKKKCTSEVCSLRSMLVVTWSFVIHVF